MKSLHNSMLLHGSDKATWHHYCESYEQWLPEPETPVRLLEFGVLEGGSLKGWADYYERGEIHGFDIRRYPYKIFGNRITTHQGDQNDFDRLVDVAEAGRWDIVIDDGHHSKETQQNCIDAAWPFVKSGGIYIVEDIEDGMGTLCLPTDIEGLWFLRAPHKQSIGCSLILERA